MGWSSLSQGQDRECVPLSTIQATMRVCKARAQPAGPAQAEDVAQGQGPGFDSQYHKKGKK